MTLRSIFDSLSRRSAKFEHYFAIYERHLSKFIGKSPVVVEIGVDDGGSLEMWERWFGPGSTVIGIDHNPKCRGLGLNVLIGKQRDVGLMSLPKMIDVVIDDGSHQYADQTAALDALNDRLALGSVYIIEDLHARWANPSLYAKPGDPKHGVLDPVVEATMEFFRKRLPFGSICLYPQVLVIEQYDGRSLDGVERRP